MLTWLRFIIIPSIFSFTFIAASNFALQFNQLLAVGVMLLFLWLVGFTAYMFAPYKSTFLALTLVGVLVAKNILKILYSDLITITNISYAWLVVLVFIAPYLGLWKARKKKFHYESMVAKQESTIATDN